MLKLIKLENLRIYGLDSYLYPIAIKMLRVCKNLQEIELLTNTLTSTSLKDSTELVLEMFYELNSHAVKMVHLDYLSP